MKDITESLGVVFDFCENYPDTGHGAETSSPKVRVVRDELDNIGKLLLRELQFSDWEFRSCKGAGAFPRIPWVVFCPKSSKAPKSGIYLCIAFSETGNGLVCGVIAATGEKEQWVSQLKKIDESSGISINGKKPNTKYGDAFFNPKIVFRNALSVNDLIQHLRESEVLHSQLTAPASLDHKPVLHDFKWPDEDWSARLLRSSLLTKSFAILTGGSGTGKTKLAESLAGHLRNNEDVPQATNLVIVPVGADWTDNRNVLGFVNHLRPDGNPVFQSTPVLDLLLEASEDEHKETPFFLILDEMNLSHVERYFADFLSVMEQQNGFFQLHSEGPREDFEYVLPRYDGDETGVPRVLKYPENLFVIGTVNVDETTYMFSPKVLDRANVIEFFVTADQIDSFLQEPKEYPEVEKAADGVAEGFQKLALSARNGELDDLPEEVALSVRTHLVDLFELLKRGRFEFAYRTSNEVIRYMKVCRHLTDDKDEWDNGGWLNDLDDQIVQKILPKLHGSMGRVGRLLGALATYAAGKSRENSMAWFPAEGAAPPLLQNALKDVEERDHPEFPDSRKKLCSMIEVLLDEQFVSFIN